ncbi:TM2 domain-containing protein [Paenibacillus sp. HW567]|uniref:TM2 domain-containing protein n=1 Tax=Paenibacillus sp. HW567 TaxID=1034769 RepID=UPI00037FDC1A|nr:TM2 domain-containing protein [Paenibacillus sp. HW567]
MSGSNLGATKPNLSDQTKFCKHCGERIHLKAVICNKCGLQVEELNGGSSQPQIVINNSNMNTNINNNGGYGNKKDKWISVLLCFFLGVFGVHRFYEGKIGTGILYLFTFGLMGIGTFVDFIILLFKPNPYYV